ncbi:MAG TPA: hypothetical protein DCY79_05005 [Planctomycetaceae bacterium]|nr:hypothetical protein [Blastopirellula sp.]HAY79148.1 hypothetical protein [Planctomycetaceae bacterium]
MTRTSFLVCTLTIWAVMSSNLSAGRQDGRLDVYWIDVEGGAATLMITPAGESILIDTGNPGLRDPGRIAKVVNEVARVRGVDHLIITHYHRDHYGGAEQLSTMLPIKNIYDNGVFDGMPDNPGKAYFELKAGQRHVINPGTRLSLKKADGSKVHPQLVCLGTRKQFVSPQAVAATKNDARGSLHKPKDRDGSDNANSVVMLLSYGPFQFYDGGDLTWNQEKRLVHPYNLVGEVDVYQVTHHGLNSSNNPIVLQSLQPRVAIMNNGDRKGCTPEVFANLKATRSIEAIYQVHKNLRADGKNHNVADEFIANFADAKGCQGHYIKLSVAPDGASYTVAIPAHGHQAEYQTK